MPPIIFLVICRDLDENVIVSADSREQAKKRAFYYLGDNPDRYVVEPITKPGTRTTFLLNVE